MQSLSLKIDLHVGMYAKLVPRTDALLLSGDIIVPIHFWQLRMLGNEQNGFQCYQAIYKTH